MDPYTEYLGTGLGRSEPSYRVPQPRARRRVRNNRWRPRALQR